MNGEMHSRRDWFLGLAAVSAACSPPPPLAPITVRINVMFDAARAVSREKFWQWQSLAAAQFAASGLRFAALITEGAFLRQQGYSELPDRFLRRGTINVFVTTALGYDIDRDRTGGACIGPRARRPGFAADPFYKIFVGMEHATEKTLPHEYAHHFTLDTASNPTLPGNFWTDLRNDYWLWRQRSGVRIPAFRACAGAEFAA